MPTEPFTVELFTLERVQTVDVLVPGIQGPKGEPGDPGVPFYQIHVGELPPDNPQPRDIWIDIS